jgi:hypothetical protein
MQEGCTGDKVCCTSASGALSCKPNISSCH